MDRLLFDVLNRIADNLFLIREELECLQPKPPEDDEEDSYEEDVLYAGVTFLEFDAACDTCEHGGKCSRGRWPCTDCKHMTAKRQADRYTPEGGQHGKTD